MKPLSIYIHIPFCERKCGYCSFVSFLCAEEKASAYIEALCREIRQTKKVFSIQHSVSSIYLGGGTPNLLTCGQTAQIFGALRETFTIDESAEITIEVNPNSLNIDKLNLYKVLGINRLSIGVQAFDDDVLKMLGRIHDRRTAEDAIRIAAREFNNLSIDLIHSVPFDINENTRMTKRNIQSELSYLLGKFKSIKHISLYSLTVEDGTPIKHQIENGELLEYSEEQSIQEQKDAETILKRFGFKKYEVSNFCKPTFESWHNLNYWNGGEYLGFGVAAHSLFNNRRFSNTENLDEYLNSSQVARGNTLQPRSTKDIVLETVMLGLRTVKGISIKELNGLGYDILTVKVSEIIKLKRCGLLRMSGDRIAVTDKGFFVLNSVIEKLLN